MNDKSLGGKKEELARLGINAVREGKVREADARSRAVAEVIGTIEEGAAALRAVIDLMEVDGLGNNEVLHNVGRNDLANLLRAIGGRFGAALEQARRGREEEEPRSPDVSDTRPTAKTPAMRVNLVRAEDNCGGRHS